MALVTGLAVFMYVDVVKVNLTLGQRETLMVIIIIIVCFDSWPKKKISNSNYNTNNPITKQETGKDDRCWPFSNVKNKICSMKKQKKMISWDEKKRNFSWWTQCIQWPLYVSVLSIYLFIFGWLVSWLVDFFEFFSQKFFR